MGIGRGVQPSSFAEAITFERDWQPEFPNLLKFLNQAPNGNFHAVEFIINPKRQRGLRYSARPRLRDC